MPVSISARGALGIRKEASYASGGGLDNWQIIESSTLEKRNQYIYQDRIRNTPEQFGGQFSHTVLSGQITFPVTPANPTQWWECGIGGSGPYTPNFPLSSMAIEVQEGQIGTVYTSGDMITRLELSSQKGDILRCTASIEGADMTSRVASTATFSSGDDAYLHSECTFTLDGVVNNDVESFSVSQDNNIILDLYGNTPRRREIPATKATVTGSIALLFSDTGMRNRFFNQLPSRIVALYARAGRSFEIQLNNINYDVDSRPLQGQTSFILETLNFTAFVKDPTAQNSIKVTVV